MIDGVIPPLTLSLHDVVRAVITLPFQLFIRICLCFYNIDAVLFPLVISVFHLNYQAAELQPVPPLARIIFCCKPCLGSRPDCDVRRTLGLCSLLRRDIKHADRCRLCYRYRGGKAGPFFRLLIL
jgi:hypothetical protein